MAALLIISAQTAHKGMMETTVKGTKDVPVL
jgi:hypothetical protein